MMQIFKYNLDVQDIQMIQLQKGAKILSIGVQFEYPVIWALVDELAPLEERYFRIIGTGHPIDPEGRIYNFPMPGNYLGTFQLTGAGTFVGHVFEA